jgi:hypothetical protein
MAARWGVSLLKTRVAAYFPSSSHRTTLDPAKKVGHLRPPDRDVEARKWAFLYAASMYTQVLYVSCAAVQDHARDLAGATRQI